MSLTPLTTTEISDLNNSNVAHQRASVGTLLGQLSGGVIVKSQSIIADLGTATYVHAAIALTDATQEITTAITNPDVPRCVTVKGNDGNVAGNVVFVGTNIDDEAITETVVASGTSEVAGTKAFKTVTSITVPVYDTADTETISIGASDKLGLSEDRAAYLTAKVFDGSADSGTATAGATVELNVYDPAGTLDGSKVLELFWISA